MKKVIFVIFLSFLFPLEAQWWGCPCMERYYNPSSQYSDGLPYGYFDVNEYPYSLPVNYCFNPRPCKSCRRSYANYNYFIWCAENSQPTPCPYCNEYH